MIKQIKKTYIIEDEDEIKLLKFLLDYCYHRSSQHRTPVSKMEDRINILRKQLAD
jgi:hypothetical protein